MSSRLRPFQRVGAAGEFERHRDVLDRGHRRDEMERLEHDADVRAAKARERVFGDRGQFLAGDLHRAFVGRAPARPSP